MESKNVHYDQTTVTVPGAPGNPPPYPGLPTAPQSYQPVPPQEYQPPQPGFTAPGMYPNPQVQVAYPQGIAQGSPPVVMIARGMGPKPEAYQCHACHKHIVTRVETSPTTKTHLMAILLCVLGCFPCACLPYCMDSCMASQHYCPDCNAYIGTYQNS